MDVMKKGLRFQKLLTNAYKIGVSMFLVDHNLHLLLPFKVFAKSVNCSQL